MNRTALHKAICSSSELQPMAMKQVALNSIESDDDNIKAWYSTHGQ